MTTAAGIGGRAFCVRVLPGVSRTFALVIRLLPPSLSHAVTVSYLVCRIADSIEDQLGLSRELRVQQLSEVRRAVLDSTATVDELPAAQFDGTVRELIAGVNIVLQELHHLPTRQLAAIRPSVIEMIDGMASCLPATESAEMPLFQTMQELRQYCYYVAGTVGHLLTGLFIDHRPPRSLATRARLTELAPTFGLVLQLTNIIRDVTADRGLDRNHVPLEVWRASGLDPAQMFSDGYERESWNVLAPLLDEAQRNVAAAIEYVTLLPRSGVRVRLFCLTPLLHACRTLRLIEKRRTTLASGSTVRMSRAEVYALTVLAALVAPANSAIRAAFRVTHGALIPIAPLQAERNA